MVSGVGGSLGGGVSVGGAASVTGGSVAGGAPVEAGSVLADLCADPATSALRESIVLLTRNYRFDAASGIGRLARAIRDADPDEALEVLQELRRHIRLTSAEWEVLPSAVALQAIKHY